MGDCSSEVHVLGAVPTRPEGRGGSFRGVDGVVEDRIPRRDMSASSCTGSSSCGLCCAPPRPCRRRRDLGVFPVGSLTPLERDARRLLYLRLTFEAPAPRRDAAHASSASPGLRPRVCLAADLSCCGQLLSPRPTRIVARQAERVGSVAPRRLARHDRPLPEPTKANSFGHRLPHRCVSFRPRGFAPPRRLSPVTGSRACCIPVPDVRFAAFRPPPTATTRRSDRPDR
jgi:hypothetical protein